MHGGGIDGLDGLETDTLVELRRRLHRQAELSSREEKTAELVDLFLGSCRPDRVLRGLGDGTHRSHGAAYVFEAESPGPTVLLRCELDALPIAETIELDHASRSPGVSHKCGHDGHMAIVAGVAASLARRGPIRGRAVLLFQPAEETGEGAARVLTDTRLAGLAPDAAVALHNLPACPLGQVVLRRGAFNCASVGLVARLEGESSHAAEPEQARSPAAALARLLDDLPALAAREPPDAGALLTITHASLGEPTLGITPGEATLMATLRASSDGLLGELARRSEDRIREAAASCGLEVSLERREPFRACCNAPHLVDAVGRAADALGLPVRELEQPLRWSEDFAEFGVRYPSVLFGLGAGLDQPPLHSPAYDFPDALLPIGVRLLRRILDDLLQKNLLQKNLLQRN